VAEKTIILYGTTWCPQTARAKRYLAECGAKFTWCDIEKDTEGCAYVESVNGGNRSVPTILFPDGSILVEPSSAELESKVRELKKS
jgi:mycoredoxin